MPENYLPLSVVRSHKLTIPDVECLRICASALCVSEAEIVRLAIRRFALVNGGGLLSERTLAAAREVLAGVLIAPPQFVRMVRGDSSLVARLADEPDLGDALVAESLPADPPM